MASLMKHLGLENDLTPPEHLVAMARLWHYGWKWRGPEDSCDCFPAPCGLIEQVQLDCPVPEHDARNLGYAKQIHKASDCPGPCRPLEETFGVGLGWST